jgi:hypothetical protein
VIETKYIAGEGIWLAKEINKLLNDGWNILSGPMYAGDVSGGSPYYGVFLEKRTV